MNPTFEWHKGRLVTLSTKWWWDNGGDTMSLTCMHSVGLNIPCPLCEEGWPKI